MCDESLEVSRVARLTFVPVDSTAICGEARTAAVLMISLKSSALNDIEISGSGIASSFSGGVTIIVGSQKRYFVFERPLLLTMITFLSSNSNVGSVPNEITDKKLFRS